jgi:hypothetical protein
MNLEKISQLGSSVGEYANTPPVISKMSVGFMRPRERGDCLGVATYQKSIVQIKLA